MKTIIITSKVGKKIVPVQKWLFEKYAPNIKPEWIDLEDQHIEKWCKNVANGIKDLCPKDYVLFMLDDHLLFDHTRLPKAIPAMLDRLELGRTWSHHKNTIDMGDYLAYRKDTLYQVSCQPSIWKTESLLKVLEDINSNPWEFERKGRCKAGIVKRPAMVFIAETAISSRKQGKVNINGIKPEDARELIKIGLLNEGELCYSWK